MNFKLLTPDRQVFSGEAELVGGRTEEGSFSLLPRHIPAVMELEPATVKVEGPEGIKRFVVHGGFLFKERDETVRLLTREARDYEELDSAELEERIEDLEQRLDGMDKEKAGASYEKARSELDRAKLSLSLIENE
ncbi:MAG: F0F1 ATP synthase subunit epsilon [Candidatus Bipolaricaulia bacterium]